VLPGAAVEVAVAWGVFATVESPEPQPVTVAPINTATDRAHSGSARHACDHTSRTVPFSGSRVWQACRDPPRSAPLSSRSPRRYHVP